MRNSLGYFRMLIGAETRNLADARRAYLTQRGGVRATTKASAWFTSLLWCALLTGAGQATAGEASVRNQFMKLDREVQFLKKEVLAINHELLLLEEELLYPLEHRLVVFVTMAEDSLIRLNTIRLDLDGETVVRHQYTDSESSALQGGGVHKLYVAKLDKGDHVLQASLSGSIVKTGDISRQHATGFEKGLGPKYIELRIEDGANQQGPEIRISQW